MEASQKNRDLRSRFESFCRHHQVEILYAFGSRAHEIHHAIEGGGGLEPEQPSDVDIAVKLSRDRMLSVREKAELAVALENLMGVNRVDLVILSQADLFWRSTSFAANACSARMIMKPMNTSSMSFAARGTWRHLNRCVSSGS